MTKSKKSKRHHNCVIEIRHQNNVTKFSILSPIKISGYASVEDWSTARKTITIYNVSAKKFTCKNCV